MANTLGLTKPLLIHVTTVQQLMVLTTALQGLLTVARKHLDNPDAQRAIQACDEIAVQFEAYMRNDYQCDNPNCEDCHPNGDLDAGVFGMANDPLDKQRRFDA